MRLIRRDRHLRIILARISLRQPMAISPLMESAQLIDLCRLMKFLHHMDLHPPEPKLRGHHRRTDFPHLIALHQEDRLPLAPMIRPFPIHMDSVSPLLKIRLHRIALLHPMSSAHITVLRVEHHLTQLRLLTSLL